MDYESFVSRKGSRLAPSGIDAPALNPALFDYQKDLVEWALRRGRAAIFADTGLGKTLMQVEWARAVSESTGGRVLIIAPLAVSQQTVREAARFGIDVRYLREDDGAKPIVVTNYEMMGQFPSSRFAGVVLDESSILKSYTGAFRNEIIAAFSQTPFRLACTATPAPNDYTELGNHSEFLGALTRSEMLSEFFVHDGGSTQDWRLKGHAIGAFWRWVCDWGAVVSSPADLGYDAADFDLPPLTHEELPVALESSDAWSRGDLVHLPALGLRDQRESRRATTEKRVQAIAERVNAERDEPALVWCEYNDESAQIVASIPDAVEVKGSDSQEQKSDRLLGFAEGRYRVLVTKPKIAGFGMNWQHCARVYFAGPSHSFESTYQAIRRCWRFGQTRPVVVRTCVSELDRAIVDNLARKGEEAREMRRQVVAHVRDAGFSASVREARKWDRYNASERMEVPSWLVSA